MASTSYPTHISDHPIDPLTLLTYLRQSLHPIDPLYSRLPAILDVFAIFHQLSEALIREAGRAIQAQAALLLANRKAGIEDSAIVKYGGLSAGHGKVLMRIKGRWDEGDDRMAVWSLNIRKYHVAMQLADTSRPLAEVRRMVDLYFPLDPAADAAPLFCRVIQGVYLPDAARLREEVIAWIDAVDEDRRVSRPGLEACIEEELTGRPATAIGTIARNILVEAERVYTDLQDMQALFRKDQLAIKAEPIEPAVDVKSEPMEPSEPTRRRVSFRQS